MLAILSRLIDSSPALGQNGCIYFTSRHESANSSILYAISGKTLVGDINKDGIVDILDVVFALRMALDLPVNSNAGILLCHIHQS